MDCRGLVVALLAVLTFVPLPFVHPFRVRRLRAGRASRCWRSGRRSAAVALLHDLAPGPWVTAALCAHCALFPRLSDCSPPRSRDWKCRMLELLTDPHAWAALVTLTVLEIVLGIDNVVFISVLVSRLRPREGASARARSDSRSRFVFRVVLLFGLTWLMGLTAPVFTMFGHELSWRDLILIGGGLFLIAKATHEIHAEVEARDDDATGAGRRRAVVLLGGAAADRDRSRVLAQLDHHRDRHGAGHRDHDRGDRDRHGRDVCGLRAGRGVHRRASDHQDAGARLPGADRRGAGRRRLRGAYSARLHLFLHGVRRRGRGLQRAGARNRRAAARSTQNRTGARMPKRPSC